mgnify:FL=1
MKIRESMNRIFYRSRFTKRFQRYLELCKRAGLVQEEINAKELIVAINANL